MPTDRELRDELERLQVEARKLAAELEPSRLAELESKRAQLAAAVETTQREYASTREEIRKLTDELGSIDARTDALIEQLIRWLNPDRR